VKNAGELSEVVEIWLNKYRHYRQYEALDGMTTAEFSAKLGVSIPKGLVPYI
jgi:transposase InsO family protein